VSPFFFNNPTNAQLIEKLFYCTYMFQHCCVLSRGECSLYIVKLQMYVNADVGNTYNLEFHVFFVVIFQR
jgi:hypothetical protein